MINGVSLAGLSEFVHEVRDDPAEARIDYGVRTSWLQGTRCAVRTLPARVGRHVVSRDFCWVVDEPRPLLGLDRGPSPQEVLLSGLGSCMLVAYSVGAAVMGIQLDSLELDLRTTFDLRGFLRVDDADVALERIAGDVWIESDGDAGQLGLLHRHVRERSPNRVTLGRAIPIDVVLHLHAREAAVVS